jgi:hypothetical protein
VDGLASILAQHDMTPHLPPRATVWPTTINEVEILIHRVIKVAEELRLEGLWSDK